MMEMLNGWAWFVLHPSLRRCSRCKVEWELRRVMRARPGLCHDCWLDDVLASSERR